MQYLSYVFYIYSKSYETILENINQNQLQAKRCIFSIQERKKTKRMLKAVKYSQVSEKLCSKPAQKLG